MSPPRSRASDPGDRHTSSANGNGKGNGLIRPPTAFGGSRDENSDRRSSNPGGTRSRSGDSPSRSGRGEDASPRSRTDTPPSGNGRGRGQQDEFDEDYSSVERPRSRASARPAESSRGGERGPRRSVRELARDVSRNMSRQLSAVMSRAHIPRPDRSARQDSGERRPNRQQSYEMPSLPPDLAATIKARAYRRSRIRGIARKWREGRVPPNPLVYIASLMFLAVLAVAVAGGGGFGAYYAVSYYQLHLGDIQTLANLKNQANSTIYDRYGTPIAVLKGDSDFSFYVPLSQISPKVQWATIDTENRSFYTDVGIDFIATLRAATVDARKGGAAQGASTLTQQLVKNIVLKDSTKALTRKLNEAILAYGITQQYTKAQILEMYLNTVYYNGLYKGIEAAARYYFHLSPQNINGQYLLANQQLDWAQAAMMAAVINNPTIYHPDQFSCSKAPCTMDQWDDPYEPGHECDPNYYVSDFGPDWYLNKGHEWLALCRSELVLQNLEQYQGQGITFTQNDYTQSVAELKNIFINQLVFPLSTYSQSNDSGSALDLAPHFVEYVANELANDYGVSALDTAGLTIYTTLDLKLNQEIQKELKYYIDQNHKNPWYPDYQAACGGLDCPLSTASNANDGAAVAIDQHTGDILAMVGSVNYSDHSKEVAGAVNVTTSPRSMGSAFKPLIYSAAFQMGWTPGTMLHDVPICFPQEGGHSEETPAKSCGKHYVPENYEQDFYNGNFPIRYMLGNSLNIAATEAMAFVGDGPDTGEMITDWLQRLGVNDIDRNRLGPTTALGTEEIPLLQLTGAYSVFADGGVRQPPRAILRVEDSSGNVVYQASPQPKGAQVMSPESAYMMTSILTDNKARAQDFGYTKNPIHFEASRGEPSGIELAAKTGTSSGPTGPRDILTVGYSPFVTLGVWIGNADAEDMASDIIGVAGAGYIFHDAMMWMYKNYHWPDVAQFPVPSDMVQGYFNCNTGLAPYQGDPATGVPCNPSPPPFTANCKPWCSLDLYKLDNGLPKVRPDLDWYIRGQAPLLS
jgi:membrane peptidoglycan carboxypeptidase